VEVKDGGGGGGCTRRGDGVECAGGTQFGLLNICRARDPESMRMEEQERVDVHQCQALKYVAFLWIFFREGHLALFLLLPAVLVRASA